MNKRGKFYITLLCALSLFLLFSAYYKVSATYKQHSEYGLTENVGEKQAALLNAVTEGERIIMYVKEANRLVAVQASVENPCGEPYLSAKLVGRGSCQSSSVRDHMRELSAVLAAYPAGTLNDILWRESKMADGTVTIEGTKLIPITAADYKRSYSTATFTGQLASWPTEVDTITSVFGKRDISVAGASKNHPGIDIAVPDNAVGKPITSLTEGSAIYYVANDVEDSWVQVDVGGVVFKYMHVSPAEGIPTYREGVAAVPVTAGQLIAYTAPHRGNPHLHLTIEVPQISSAAAKEKWPTHTSASTGQSEEKSYAVTRNPADSVILDPVCFFERTYITNILRKSNKLAGDTFEACDAYERDFALSERLQAPEQEAVPVQSAQLPPEMQERFDKTRQNVERYGLLRFIGSALEKEKDDAPISDKFILAVITQESMGEIGAVSPTGAVGVMQFTYGTATSQTYDEETKSWKKMDDTYDDIFSKATPCNCQGDSCMPRACNPGNDERYNAEKNIRAGVRYYSSLAEEYAEYGEHGLAFALAAYNGGNAAVDRAIAHTKQKNAEVTWPNVKNEIAIDASVDQKKRDEIIGYVDAILQYHEAWGGVTFAQQQIAADTYGHYELHVSLDNIRPSPFDTALRQIHEQVVQCTTAQCVDNAVTGAARAANLVASHELLFADAGCFAAAERAQLYVANQFASCQASPDNNCACIFEHAVNAEYAVSSAQMQIEKLNGVAVEAEPVSGLASVASVDTAQPALQAYTAYGMKQLSTEAKLVLDGEKSYVLYKEEQPLDVRELRTQELPFTALYKQQHGLSFTSEPVRLCVVPTKPKAYCLKESDDATSAVVFFVDMQLHTAPQAELSVVEAQSALATRVVIESATRLPYVHVVAGTTHYYLHVKDTTPAGLFFEEQSLKVEDQKALYDGEKYTMMLPPHDSYTVSLMDENLRETAAVVVNPVPFSIP